MLTEPQYLMKRDGEYPITLQMRDNMDALLEAVNELEKEPGCPIEFVVSSGYRPKPYNDAAHGAPNSTHLVCAAVDIHDPNEELDHWITDAILEKFDLFREHPSKTVGWVHLTVKPPKSRKRTFLP